MFPVSRLAAFAAATFLLFGLTTVTLPALAAEDAPAAAGESDPALSTDENDPEKQPVDPVHVEKMAAEVRQVPLTEDMVQRFLDSFAEIRGVAKKFPDTRLPDSVIDETPGSEFQHMAQEKRDAMNAIAKAHGFKDVDDWSVVASSIAMSYAYGLQGKKPGEVAKTISANISEIKEDPKLSPEQKDAQIAQLEDFGQKLGKLEPLPENYALVEQMKDKIAPVMNSE